MIARCQNSKNNNKTNKLKLISAVANKHLIAASSRVKFVFLYK